MIKILVFGSNGMVGSSILNSFSEKINFNHSINKKDTNLLNLMKLKK